MDGDLFFGPENGGKYALPDKKLKACCYIHGNHIGYLEWTIGSIYRYVGRAAHPATGEDCQVIEYEDTRGKLRQLIIPFALIAKGGADLIGHLSANGFKVGTEPKAKALIQEMLNELTGAHAEIRDRLGWVPGKLLFAYKDRVLGGRETANVIFERAAFRHTKSGTRGDHDAWRDEIAAPLRGNSRPILMTCTMLASPLLRFAPQADAITINIRGDTTDGKSTEAYCAGSVQGGSDGKTGYMHTWDGTAGAIQAIASAHSDQGVIFDEVSQAGDQGQRSAYAIHNGAGRNRLSRDASLRRSEDTRTFVLSTGETDLFEMAGAKAKNPMYGGLEARTVTISSDAGCGLGIYENLHGLPHTKAGARQFANKRKLAASLNYGHAGPNMVQAIIDECNDIGEDVFRRKLAKMIEAFSDHLTLPEDADAAVRRVATSFGLICAAGRLACRWDVLPLEEAEISEAVEKCFRSWVAERGGTKAKTTTTALVALRDYISKNSGRFVRMQDVANGHGQISLVAGYKSDDTFFLLPHAWTEVLAQAPRAKLGQELDRLGLIERQPSSKGWAIVKTLPTRNGVRCYAISSRILAINDDGTLAEGDADNETDDLAERKPRPTTVRGKVVNFDDAKQAARSLRASQN